MRVAELKRSVFFPWERKGGFRGLLGRARTRAALWIALGIAVVVLIRHREEHKAAVRATRATIDDASKAVMAWRADHSGACPRELGELVRGGYVRDTPLDAWGRSLRLRCPGRIDEKGFEVWSDGPDGIPGGLDRVE